MTTYVVTGATGQLGRLVVEALLRRGVPASSVVATGRRVELLVDLAARGVEVRRADFDDPASLRAAFAGADRLLLVSGNEPGRRLAQHAAALEAAAEVGVGFVAYTSITRADSSTLLLAQEHRQTEELLAASGLPHALLRNSWYLENYTDQLPTYLEHGVAGAAGQGRVSAALRADYAEAAATVLATDGHTGAVYELGGEPFSLPELAALLAELSGREVPYADLGVAGLRDLLVGAGLPEAFAAALADADRGIAAGELLADGSDLEKLLGRPATPLREALARAVS